MPGQTWENLGIQDPHIPNIENTNSAYIVLFKLPFHHKYTCDLVESITLILESAKDGEKIEMMQKYLAHALAMKRESEELLKKLCEDMQ